MLLSRNGEGALDIAGKRDDLFVVLMDIKMPKMNGHETADSDIPIIALTA